MPFLQNPTAEEDDTQCQANNKLDLEMAHSPSYTHCAQTECNKQILLSTAIVNIQGKGQMQTTHQRYISPEEKMFEDLFTKTTTRDKTAQHHI